MKNVVFHRTMTLALIALLPGICPAAAPDVPEAVILELQGRARVLQSTQEWLEAASGMGLAEGETLSVRHGKAVLLWADGRLETVAGEREIRLRGTAGGSPPDGGVLGRLWGALKRRMERAGDVWGRFSKAGALRSEDALTIESPRNGPLLAAPRRISWKSVGDFRSYEVLITDGDSETRWSGTTKGTSIDVPVGELRLDPGEYYFVDVLGRGDGRSWSAERTYFEILEEVDGVAVLEQIRQAESKLSSVLTGPSLARALEILREDVGLAPTPLEASHATKGR